MTTGSLRSKGAILAALVAAAAGVCITPCLFSSSTPIDQLLVMKCLSYLVMAIIPYVLAKVVPKAARFDNEWLPRARSHWAWFLLMVAVVLAVHVSTCWLMYASKIGRGPSPLIQGHVTAVKLTLLGLTPVLLGPIAEEIFFRGFLLEQLRKLTYSPVALLLHSILFSLPHVVSQGVVSLVAAFWLGLILGWWRIRFRSLLPLVLAHAIVNAAVTGPEFMALRYVGPLGTPKGQQIAALTLEPPEKAVPSLIGFLSDPDLNVQSYAIVVLNKYFRKDAEPYLRRALASTDSKTVQGVLFAVQMGRYVGLTGEVRRLAWSGGDFMAQSSAVAALDWLGDGEGLREIAGWHPNEKVRGMARQMIKWREEKAKEKPNGDAKTAAEPVRQ